MKKKIAKILHAEPKGKVSAKGGYFGALQLFAEVNKRFRVPERGGRATDPAWTERRLLPLTPDTLKRLQKISNRIRKHQHVSIEPMQLAALLVEKTTEELTEEEVEELVATSKF